MWRILRSGNSKIHKILLKTALSSPKICLLLFRLKHLQIVCSSDFLKCFEQFWCYVRFCKKWDRVSGGFSSSFRKVELACFFPHLMIYIQKILNNSDARYHFFNVWVSGTKNNHILSLKSTTLQKIRPLQTDNTTHDFSYHTMPCDTGGEH